MEQTFKKFNPGFPFKYYFTDDEIMKNYKSEYTVSKLSRYFAFLAIFISCLGLFGLVMFTAEQKTKEIGIRKVLGASVTAILFCFGIKIPSFNNFDPHCINVFGADNILGN